MRGLFFHGRISVQPVFPVPVSMTGYRTFRVGFNADGASVYRASLAFIFFEKIYKGGQNVLVKSLKTLANTGEIGFYFFIRT